MCSRLAICPYHTAETRFYYIYSKQRTIKGTSTELILELLTRLPCAVQILLNSHIITVHGAKLRRQM